nr:LuxR family transcriptional regulator [Shimia biformata]
MECLWERHCEKMAEFGFDRLIYGCSNYMSPTGFGDMEDFIVLSNHDRDYLDAFLSDGLYYDSPMMSWVLSNTGAKSWSENMRRLAANELSDGEKKVLEFNRRFNVVAGYTISFPSSSQRFKGAMALAAKPGLSQEDVDALWAERGSEIHLINSIVNLKIITLPYTRPKRQLTKRQREVLEWVGMGKTVQDIATLIDRTPATVEKHLRLARESLCVDTTAQALMKAAFQHQIFTNTP